MIRRGKADGWLVADNSSILPWAQFHGASFNNVDFRPVEGKGMAVVATASRPVLASEPLMQIPLDLILSKENVQLHAKSDTHFRSILEALGDFGRTARGCILIFMLVQVTHLCPTVTSRIGVASPLIEYIKHLPMEPLPTFWSDDELETLVGTSLAPAMDAKMKSLHREFDLLRSATRDMKWCNDLWWDEVDGLLKFDDWKQVDAIYRSRALEFPGIGDCMAPCMDFCNHASGDQTSASYESGDCAMLLLRDQADTEEGQEITITYGDEKGACEMVFSYGFLEESMSSARDLFLDLEIPDDDPLKRAKQMASSSAPGARLFDGAGGLDWNSDYIWLCLVNEEDGLTLEAAQVIDGSQALRAFWKSEPLADTARLKDLLQLEANWKIYELRAVCILQERVGAQLKKLYDTERFVEERCRVTSKTTSLVLRLRALETELLERFYEHLEANVGLQSSSRLVTEQECDVLMRDWVLSQKLELAATPEVQRYLASSASTADEGTPEDFS